eukprot:COSAG01_NODE_160_length_23692_cov_9.703599_15_plen_154_part_00
MVAAALGAVPRSSVRLLDAHAALQAAGSSLRSRRGLASWQVADPQFGAANKLRWVRQPPHAAIGSQWVQTPRHGDPMPPPPHAQLPRPAQPALQWLRSAQRRWRAGDAMRCERSLCCRAPLQHRTVRDARAAGMQVSGRSHIFCGRFDCDLPI